MPVRARHAGLVLAGLLGACRAAPVLPTPTDEAAQIRAQIAAADDDVVRAGLREDLATLELRRARDANTVFAYRHFLAEFPTGAEATTARNLLETLRFSGAQKASTRVGWEAFLEEHPTGAHAAAARAALGSLEIGVALASTDRSLIQRTLARFPEHARRPELLAHEDALAFLAARQGGLDALEQYLAEHPAGAHRNEAADLKLAAETQVLVEAEDLVRLRLNALAADVRPAAKAALVGLELRLARRELDLDALRRIGGDPDRDPSVAPIRDEARALVESFERVPMTPALAAAVDVARATHGLHPPEKTTEILRAGDPQERAEVLGELAERLDARDVDAVLDALESRYVGVGLAAVEALAAFARGLPKPIWEGLSRSREQESLARALSAAPWRKVAALRDAAGRTREALEAWREVLRGEPDDLVARARVLALETKGQDKLAIGAAARDLARSVTAFGDDRWLQPQGRTTPAEERRDGPGEVIGLPAGLTVVRQLCSALELGDTARQALSSLRTGTSGAEQEIYGLAIADLEKLLTRLAGKRSEMEREVRSRTAGYVPCGAARLGARLDAARAERVAAIEVLGSGGDRRVRDFVLGLQRTPSDRVRAAAAVAADRLAAAPPEPPAPPPPPPVKKARRR